MLESNVFTNENNKYVFDDRGDSSAYLEGLRESLKTLNPFLTQSQKKSLIADLQLLRSDKGFDEPKYFQAACETTITASFARLYPENFKYEEKISPPKDVDCSFVYNGYKFNIEVKCADYSKKHVLDQQDGIKAGFFGRHPDKDTVLSDISEMLQGQLVIEQLPMDNKLKDFLVSANGKFSDIRPPQDLNVLIVCCDDESDMQDWLSYLYGHLGLFTEQSFHPSSAYQNVDIVMFTNVYHRHYKFFEKNHLEQHWYLDSAFNIIFPNPRRKQYEVHLEQLPYGIYSSQEMFYFVSFNKKIDSFMRAVKNYSHELFSFKVAVSSSNRDEQNFIDLASRIKAFVHEELFAKGVYLFEPPSN